MNHRRPEIVREAAWARLEEMLSGPSRWKGPGSEPTDEELTEEIVSGIKEDRRTQRKGNR